MPVTLEPLLTVLACTQRQRELDIALDGPELMHDFSAEGGPHPGRHGGPWDPRARDLRGGVGRHHAGPPSRAHSTSYAVEYMAADAPPTNCQARPAALGYVLGYVA